jgi:hypothetical protein
MTGTPSTIVFADTETTSLRPDRRIWNIGLIIRYAGQQDLEQEIIIRDVDLTHADPMGLRIGHFWERHPMVSGEPGAVLMVADERSAAYWLMERVRPTVRHTSEGTLIEPVHIAGAVPNFDVEGFAAMFARHGLCWPAHYHLLDVGNIALGSLAARGKQVGLPYTGEAVSELLGLDMNQYEKHTALGDARWARDHYDAAMRPIISEENSALAGI